MGQSQTITLKVGQWVTLLALVCFLYKTILIEWGADLWNDDNYSHGMLIPFISLYFINQRWPKIRAAMPASSLWGFFLLLLGLALFILGSIGAEFFSKRFSLLLVLGGLIYFMEGRERAAFYIFPVGILFFAIPLPYVLYNAIAFPMKLLATKIAVWFLGLYGLAVFREGNIVHLPYTTLEVVDACSGIRSLMTLVTLAFFLAYMRHNRLWKQGLLMLLALPIAIGSNAIRVALNGVVSKYYADFVDSFWHEFSGWLLFVCCFAVLWGVSALLGGDEVER